MSGLYRQQLICFVLFASVPSLLDYTVRSDHTNDIISKHVILHNNYTNCTVICFYNQFRHCGLHAVVCTGLKTRFATRLCVQDYELWGDRMGTESCSLMQLLRAAEDWRGRPEQPSGVSQIDSTTRLSTLQHSDSSPTYVRVPRASNRPKYFSYPKQVREDTWIRTCTDVFLFFVFTGNHWLNNVSFSPLQT